MLRNSLTCIKLWFLFQFLLLDVNCQMIPLKPKKRTHHTATYIDDKLYILGGIINLSTDGNFFYHDFSVKFNTKNLTWHDLSNINSVPPIHFGAASARGGENNNTLFLYGGSKKPNMALVYTFDSQNEIWSVPEIKVPDISVNVTRRVFLTGIVDYNEKMYLWGGLNSVRGDVVVVDFFILDTRNLRWEKGSLANAPISRYEYGATILPNQNIIYMGGHGPNTNVPLNEVFIYDTINNSWSTKTTSGTIPSSRYDFSVVLGLDGQRIIIFGGLNSRQLEINDSLYVLNLNNFEWYIPKISGQIPKSRYGHKADVIGKYMVISFGLRLFDVTSDEGDILLLDISNNDEYVWTNEFEPLLLSSPETATLPATSLSATRLTTATSQSATATSLSPFTNKSSLSAASIAGAVVGTLLGGILLLLGCFFLYKWNRKRNNKLLIPGSENREGNNKSQEMAQLTINNNYNHGREVLQAPRNESTTNHELLTISDLKDEILQTPKHDNNKKLSLQDIDGDALQHLKDEMLQSLRQEIIQNLQNNGQASSSNITKSV